MFDRFLILKWREIFKSGNKLFIRCPQHEDLLTIISLTLWIYPTEISVPTVPSKHSRWVTKSFQKVQPRLWYQDCFEFCWIVWHWHKFSKSSDKIPFFQQCLWWMVNTDMSTWSVLENNKNTHTSKQHSHEKSCRLILQNPTSFVSTDSTYMYM